MVKTLEAASVELNTRQRRGELRLLKEAFTFLSILPLGAKRVDATELGRSSRYFPIVGLAFGLILVAIVKALPYIGPTELTGVCLVIALAVLSRGLHIDGVADTVDGLLGGKSKEDALRIMKDSSIGAFGVASLILLIIAKVQFINILAISEMFIPFIILVPVYSRWAAVLVAGSHRSLNEKGLGKTFSDSVGNTELVVSTAFVMAISLFLLGPIQVAVLVILYLLALYLLTLLLTGNIKVVNGDILGATIEIQETLTLLILIVMTGVL